MTYEPDLNRAQDTSSYGTEWRKPQDSLSATLTHLVLRFGKFLRLTAAEVAVIEAPALRTVVSGDDGFVGPRRRLKEITDSGSASPRTASLASTVMEALEQAGLPPERLVLDADRTISYFFFGAEHIELGAHRLMASLTCSEDGLSALLIDRVANRTDAWDVEEEMAAAIDSIRVFIAG